MKKNEIQLINLCQTLNCKMSNLFLKLYLVYLRQGIEDDGLSPQKILESLKWIIGNTLLIGFLLERKNIYFCFAHESCKYFLYIFTEEKLQVEVRVCHSSKFKMLPKSLLHFDKFLKVSILIRLWK